MAVQKRVVVVGDDTSGKTALINAITSHNRFSENYVPTTWEKYRREIEMEDGEKLLLIMTDTAGHDDFVQLRPPVYRGANPDVILLCFSIGDEGTLLNIVDKWKPELRHYCPEVPIVLVGNKVDRRLDYSFGAISKHLVTLDRGKSVADAIRAIAYIECSAKTGEGISEIIQTILKAPERISSPFPLNSTQLTSPVSTKSWGHNSRSPDASSPNFNNTPLSFNSTNSNHISQEDEAGDRVRLFQRDDENKDQIQEPGAFRISLLSDRERWWLTYAKILSILVPFLLFLNFVGIVIGNLQNAGIFL